jgi:hypothetical protein
MNTPWSLNQYDLDGQSPDDLAAQIQQYLGRAPAGFDAPSRVTSVDPKSGLKQQGTNTESDKYIKLLRELSFPPKEVMRDAIDVASNAPDIKSQRAALDNIRQAILAQAASSGGASMTPGLSYLANYFTKGEAKYIPPEKSPKQTLLDYALKIQDDQRDLAKNVADYVGKFKGGYSQDQNTKSSGDTYVISSGNAPKTATVAAAAVPEKLLDAHEKRMRDLEGLKESFVATQNALGKAGIDIDNYNGEDIPGAGESKYIPTALLSPAGSDIKQTFTQLKTDLQYAKSGKQINEAEYRRLSQALGDSYFSGDRELVGALKRFRTTFAEIMRNREGAVRGLHPEVIDIFRQGGGFSSDDFVRETTKAAKNTTQSPARSGPALTHEQEKRRQELLKKAGGK